MTESFNPKKGGKKKGGPPRRTKLQPRKAQDTARTSVPRVTRAPNKILAGLGRRHHFNAFGTLAPQALAFSIGPAARIIGAKRNPLGLDKEWHKTLLAFNPVGGYYQLMVARQQTENGTWTSVVGD